MEDCIFCKILKGEIPAYKVYEDELTFAFLDIHPIQPGHTLVISKKHEPNLFDLPESDYQALMLTVRKLSKTINEKLQPKRVGMMVIGWDVPHAHAHVVPMNNSGDITSKSILEGKRAEPSGEELQKIKDLIATDEA